eukprot:14550807-Alexandrium_andersonii.AAC.1
MPEPTPTPPETSSLQSAQQVGHHIQNGGEATPTKIPSSAAYLQLLFKQLQTSYTTLDDPTTWRLADSK